MESKTARFANIQGNEILAKPGGGQYNASRNSTKRVRGSRNLPTDSGEEAKFTILRKICQAILFRGNRAIARMKCFLKDVGTGLYARPLSA
ncbi:MAG: hypothetical protein JXR76_16675, partial [Deltaproteobacteria bacterium]|nr:hypothetical protein [Deltaproteobacteria bacterium]